MDPAKLRSVIVWSNHYRADWDRTPGAYRDDERVGWGRSRRLGLYKSGQVKAYIGVQHIDPDKPGWGFIESPACRFFVSLFVGGECVTLRTFPSVDDVLDHLSRFISMTTK